MGKLIWNGWRTSVSDAPQPMGIVYGRNLKNSSTTDSAKQKKVPQVGQDNSDGDRTTNKPGRDTSTR